MRRGWTVGEVAARSGVAVSALHFYERKGLISSDRTSGRQRRYSPEVLRRISIIKFAQELGISLAEIKSAMAGLPRDRAPNRADWQAISARWSKELDLRIERLRRLRNNLAYCIGCGCLSLRQCGIRNPRDQLAEEGPGPRHLLNHRAGSPAANE
jgi:MerR family redox-sensitive transcriptional activator SoxR